ncbi:MAG: DUF484 family protein [Gemmatimonadota bacterium]
MKSDDVAQYLTQHADFFDQHPELLGLLTVPHPQNGQAISLIERQSMLLRERIRALETKVADMIRHGEENDAIADKLVQWSRALLQQSSAALLPETMIAELKRLFSVPYAAVRVWGAAPAYAGIEATQPVSDDVLRLASSMQSPFCGSNVGFEVAHWMASDEKLIASLAMMPLRIGSHPEAFGMLVLGSSDRDRFQITMGTSFLARIAELASAAMSRLRA